LLNPKESVKTRLSDVTRDDFLVALLVLEVCLETGLKLAHPVMPFITEELFQRIRAKHNSPVQTIMLQKYPDPEEVKQNPKYIIIKELQ
jgi:valyl-tRNA synthetase